MDQEKRIHPLCLKCLNFGAEGEHSYGCVSKMCPSTNKHMKIYDFGWEKGRKNNWVPSQELINVSKIRKDVSIMGESVLGVKNVSN